MTEPTPQERSVDDTDVGWGDEPASDDRDDADDARLRADVPPHHVDHGD